MEESKVTKDNVLKQALQRRLTTDLPSNFTYRMMQQVYVEDARKRKRATRLNYIMMAMVTAFMSILAVLSIVLYADISLKQIIQPFQEAFQLSKGWGFYIYIFLLVGVLLFVDSAVRRWYYKKHAK